MNQKPFIHLFQTSNNFYLYDVNTDSILKIDEATYSYLKNEQNINTCEQPKQIEFLKKQGYLKSNKVKISEHPETEFLDYYCNNRVEGITLQVTQNCNLRCSYCTYSGGYINRVHTNKRMPFEVAKKGIDFLINHSRDCSEVSIGFYGGEPLLEFDLIKWCVEYANSHIEGKEIKYNLTTNATLITKEILDFFDKHNVVMMISLDGPKEIHDKNRLFSGTNIGSFSTIIKNLNMIYEENPNYYKKNLHFNSVLETNNFSLVDDFIKENKLFKDSLFLSSLVSETNSLTKIKKSDNFYEESQYALFIGFLNILGRIDEKYSSRLLRTQFVTLGDSRKGKQGKQRLVMPEKWHHGGPCIPGATRLLINAFGDFYPCEKVCESSEMVIGNVYSGFNFDSIEYMLNIERNSKEMCHNCWAYQYCNLCVACVGHAPNEDKLIKECATVKMNTENDFKNFCVLEDLGYDFEISELIKNENYEKLY